MRWVAGVRERLRGLFFKEAEDADMDDELRDHLERQALENERLGMSPEEARRQAAIAFGGVGRVREEVREARGLALLHELAADVRYALRALRRNPGFTTVALLTLALVIGANAAMFSVVDGVLLRPLGYPEPEELVLMYQSNPRTGELQGRASWQDVQDWQARLQSFERMAAYVPVPAILTGRYEPLEVEVAYVTEDFFDVLGAPVAMGRPLLEEDHRLRQRNAVISDALWRTHLGSDPSIVGRSIDLRGVPYTVVGVMSPAMGHPTPNTDAWIPHTLVEPNTFASGMPQRGHRYLHVVGRLASGADVAMAERELNSLSTELAVTYPESNADWNAAGVVPLHAAVVGDVDRALTIVFGVVGFILLIGWANLANLLLARGSARKRELSVRIALGAGRRRIVRQLLTENVVLALLGGTLGLLLSYLGVQAILGQSGNTLPRMDEVHVDGRVIAFGVLLSTVTGLAFGLVPALRLAQNEPQQGLRGGRGTVGVDGQSLRSALVVVEVALAVLLVVGAGLMARSFLGLRSVDPGFDPDNVLAVALQLNIAGVPEDEIVQFLVQRREQILAGVRELPGVEQAGMINAFPLRADEGAFSTEYERGGADATPGANTVSADTRYADPGYLRTMDIPLLRGDHLPSQWAEDTPVPVVMSESAARQMWGDLDPVGRYLRVGETEARIVGVVGDVRQSGLEVAASPAVYFPQLIAPRLRATLVVRTSGDPMSLAAPIRALIRQIDPNQPVRSTMRLSEVMAESIARDRFFVLLFAAFGSLALVLAAVGIYGVLAYSVRQRTQEMGVRVALGARAGDVLRLVVGAGMRLVGLGIVIGTIAAIALSSVIESQLYGIAPTDPVTFAAAIGFLSVVALLATGIPAYRATRVPPIIALRPD